jgi:hypothetical protein
MFSRRCGGLKLLLADNYSKSPLLTDGETKAQTKTSFNHPMDFMGIGGSVYSLQHQCCLIRLPVYLCV